MINPIELLKQNWTSLVIIAIIIIGFVFRDWLGDIIMGLFKEAGL